MSPFPSNVLDSSCSRSGSENLKYNASHAVTTMDTSCRHQGNHYRGLSQNITLLTNNQHEQLQ